MSNLLYLYAFAASAASADKFACANCGFMSKIVKTKIWSNTLDLKLMHNYLELAKSGSACACCCFHVLSMEGTLRYLSYTINQNDHKFACAAQV